MNKKLKIALAAFVVITSLLGLGAWYAISSVNPAQLTQLLSSSVKEATGRDLKIAGPVRLSIFPSIGVYAEDVSLSNAAWASEPDMVFLKRLTRNEGVRFE